ncbi:hypothetical protein [Streptomyces sp. NRRL S-350]|uniref:hypothetical protein n=1 Tax=Streptomyces sp. NRRL S-350 TaxID=1463902 RepID=UPI0004BF11C9|nr:hypothetical protein [Streptomyces sp. NRRL S-350]
MPSTTHYLATRPDGTVPAGPGSTIPINLLTPDANGIVRHPNPGAPGTWWSGEHLTLTLTTAAGEALEGRTWPVRLFAVEPVGESAPGGPGYRHQVRTRALRVVEETDARLALGPRAAQVLVLIEELPELAHRWASRYAADPAAGHEAYETWRLCTHHGHTSAVNARARAADAARRSRRDAALSAVRQLAVDAALPAAEEFGPRAAHYAAMRASARADAALLEDRLTDYVLLALRGHSLDRPRTAA